MYAIVESGGQQFRVEKNSQIRVNLLPDKAGSEIELKKVLLLGGESLSVGKPYLEGVSVLAEVVAHGLGEKVVIFKKRRRHDSRRTTGHRQQYTTLKIKSITA